MLAPADARVLDGLRVGGSAAAMASAAGMRRARTRGAGVEFHEYRPYQPGDDPRSIDWTVEARLQQLVVRVARAEGDLRLHLLLDTSRSMSLGEPSKLAAAARVAAALSYVAIERRDVAGLATFDDTVRTFVPPMAGRAQLFRVLDALAHLEASGPSVMDTALLHFGAAVRGPGLVAVISDFLEPGAGLQGLRFLLHRGLTPAVIQVLTREELAPAIDEDLELVDVEEPARRLVVDQSMLVDYHKRLADHVDVLRTFCGGQRLPWLQVEAHAPFTTVVAQLEAAGIFSRTV